MSEWPKVKFGDVVRLSKERSSDPLSDGYERYIGLEHIDPEDLRVRRWGNVADGVTFTSVFKPGQVLFGKRRAYQRKVAVADFAGVCSGDIYVLESKDPQELLPELLPFICQTEAFFQHAVGTSAGSLSPRTNWTSIADFEFVLPPLEEQTRLVNLMSASNALIEEFFAAHQSLTTLQSSFEKFIFTSEKYERVKVGKITKFTSGKGIRVSDLPKEWGKEHPIPVHGGNGISGYTTHAMKGTERPTVIVGRVGQFCGATSMTNGQCWITDNALHPISIHEGVTPSYLAICLRASNLNRSKLGEYLPLVTQEIVHSVEIPLPPLDEQNAIISQSTEIASGISQFESRIRDARLFHSSILKLI